MGLYVHQVHIQQLHQVHTNAFRDMCIFGIVAYNPYGFDQRDHTFVVPCHIVQMYVFLEVCSISRIS